MLKWLLAALPAFALAATLEVGGRTRSYSVHLPPNYNGAAALPLVLVLHGGTQPAAGVERMSGMSAAADRENFLAVYPSGTSRPGRGPTWNAGNCCGYALENQVDDIVFLRALIARLKKDYRVDPRRVYVTGISNGGMMSYRAACEMADLVAAVAPVEGAQNVPCSPSAPVSIVVFHGTADRLVPFEGGVSPFQVGPRRKDTPVAEAVAFWVKRNGCAAAPRHEETRQVHIDTYSGCRDGAAVALYAIQGGRHTWPATATATMWRFFAQHPRR